MSHLFQQSDTLGVVVLRGGINGRLDLPSKIVAERPAGLQFVFPSDHVHIGYEGVVVRGVVEVDRIVVSGDVGARPSAGSRWLEQARYDRDERDRNRQGHRHDPPVLPWYSLVLGHNFLLRLGLDTAHARIEVVLPPIIAKREKKRSDRQGLGDTKRLNETHNSVVLKLIDDRTKTLK